MSMARKIRMVFTATLFLCADLSANLLHAQSRIPGETKGSTMGWGGGAGWAGGGHFHRGGGSIFSPDSKLLAVVRITRVVLWDLTAKQEVAVLENDDPVRCFQFSRDGRTLAVAVLHRVDPAKDRIIIWDIDARAKRCQIEQGRIVWQMEFIGDGDKLAVASRSRKKGPGKYPQTLRVWDTDTGEELVQLDGNAGRQKKPELYRLAASPDGRLLAAWQLRTATKADIVLWDSESLTPQRTLRGIGSVGQLQFSPDGKLLAAATRVPPRGNRKDMMVGVRLWQVASGKELSATAFDDAGVKPGDAWFAFAPDSKSLIAAGHLYPSPSDSETEFRLWEFATGRESNLGLVLGDPSLIRRPGYWYVGMDFSPTGDWLAISDRQPGPQVKLWNAKSRQLVRTLEMNVEQPGAVPAERVAPAGMAFSPDGRWLAASRNTTHNTYETFVWEMDSPDDRGGRLSNAR